MAAENPELEEITHLLEVEKQATTLINDAMTEADKRRNEAHLKFNEQFKLKVNELTEKLTAEYNNSIEQIKQNHAKELEDYKKSMEQKEIDQKAFNVLLDNLLFVSE